MPWLVLILLFLAGCADCLRHPDGTLEANVKFGGSCAICIPVTPMTTNNVRRAEVNPPDPSPDAPAVPNCLTGSSGNVTSYTVFGLLSAGLSAAALAK